MSRSRFQPVEVRETGYRVALIRDTQTGRNCHVYFRAGRFRYWDVGRGDEPVAGALRRIAKEMLS